MATFMVERYLPGITYRQFAEAMSRAAAAGTAMTAQGEPIRYLGSLYVPADECSFCCFEARDAAAVREANRRADVPYWRVVRAEMLEPRAGSSARRRSSHDEGGGQCPSDS